MISLLSTRKEEAHLAAAREPASAAEGVEIVEGKVMMEVIAMREVSVSGAMKRADQKGATESEAIEERHRLPFLNMCRHLRAPRGTPPAPRRHTARRLRMAGRRRMAGRHRMVSLSGIPRCSMGLHLTCTDDQCPCIRMARHLCMGHHHGVTCRRRACIPTRGLACIPTHTQGCILAPIHRLGQVIRLHMALAPLKGTTFHHRLRHRLHALRQRCKQPRLRQPRLLGGRPSEASRFDSPMCLPNSQHKTWQRRLFPCRRAELSRWTCSATTRANPPARPPSCLGRCPTHKMQCSGIMGATSTGDACKSCLRGRLPDLLDGHIAWYHVE